MQAVRLTVSSSSESDEGGAPSHGHGRRRAGSMADGGHEAARSPPKALSSAAAAVGEPLPLSSSPSSGTASPRVGTAAARRQARKATSSSSSSSLLVAVLASGGGGAAPGTVGRRSDSGTQSPPRSPSATTGSSSIDVPPLAAGEYAFPAAGPAAPSAKVPSGLPRPPSPGRLSKSAAGGGPAAATGQAHMRQLLARGASSGGLRLAAAATPAGGRMSAKDIQAMLQVLARPAWPSVAGAAAGDGKDAAAEDPGGAEPPTVLSYQDMVQVGVGRSQAWMVVCYGKPLLP